MNIFPLHRDTADKKHWVVRWLRYTGFMEVIAAVIVGLIYSNNIGAPLIAELLNISWETGRLIAVILGGFLSFVAGLAVSLPTWALALVIDDLHALRVYNQGYVVMDGKQEG